MAPLQCTVIGLAVAGGTAVALCRNPLRQIVLSGLYGLILTSLFMVLQAPDVALSMLVVGAIAYPLIVLVVIARARNYEPDEEQDE